MVNSWLVHTYINCEGFSLKLKGKVYTTGMFDIVKVEHEKKLHVDRTEVIMVRWIRWFIMKEKKSKC